MTDTTSLQAISPENIRETNKSITQLVSALHAAQRNLSSQPSNPSNVRLASFDLTYQLFKSASVYIQYGSQYVELRMSEIPTFLERPALTAAAKFGVDEETFVEWLYALDGYYSCVPIRCGIGVCKRHTLYDCETPEKFAEAKKAVTDGAWFCKYHQQRGWDEKRMLAIDIIPILKNAARHPNGSKAALQGRTPDLEFLCSIGMLAEQRSINRTKTIYAYQLTADGQKYLESLDG